MLLGQARGAAICAAVARGLPVSEYTALQVKQAVVGNGHAAKEQVQDMVRRLLALPGDPSADAADAWRAPSATRTAGWGWASWPPRASASVGGGWYEGPGCGLA